MQTPTADLVSRVLTGTLARPTPPSSGSTPTPPASSGADVSAHEWTCGFRTLGDPKLVGLVGDVGRFRKAILAGAAPHWLTILGHSGTGKTHLAKALWGEIKRHCRWNPDACAYTPSCVYWPDLVDKLRSGEFYGFFNDMKRWPFLVLDDIGAERDPSGFAADRLSTLLGCRGGRWTLITGNLAFRDIEALDVRIASRMRRDGSQVIEVTATDYALRSNR